MAELTQNPDGTVTMTLSVVEQDTLSGLGTDQLQGYITLWLAERATQVFQERFGKLSPEDQFAILAKFRDAGKPPDNPAEPTPIVPGPEPPPERTDPLIHPHTGRPVEPAVDS